MPWNHSRLRSGYGFQFFLVSIRIFGLFNKKHLTGNPMEPWGKYWLLEMQETLNAKILGAIPGVVVDLVETVSIWRVWDRNITTSYAFWPKSISTQNVRMEWKDCGSLSVFLAFRFAVTAVTHLLQKSVVCVCVSVLHKHHSLTTKAPPKMIQNESTTKIVLTCLIQFSCHLIFFGCVLLFFEQKRVVCTRITEEKNRWWMSTTLHVVWACQRWIWENHLNHSRHLFPQPICHASHRIHVYMVYWPTWKP